MALKKIVFLVFVVFCLFVINDLVNSIYNLWQKHDLLDRANRTLGAEKKRNVELKEKLKAAMQPQFVEKEARDKLFLVKPGEGVVMVEPTVYMQASASSKSKVEDMSSYWRQWREIFFE